MCLLCSNLSGFSSYLDQNKYPYMIWVLIASTISLLFSLLAHSSLTSPSLLNKLGSSLPTASALPDHLSLVSQHQFFFFFFLFFFSINSFSKFLLASSPCSPPFSTLPACLTPLLCFFLHNAKILQYTIAYN